MFERDLLPDVLDSLADTPAVVLLGPRQSGKTTLAHRVGDVVAANRSPRKVRASTEAPTSLYLDLESPTDRRKLSDPEAYLRAVQDRLVILDEVQQMPALFPALRGLIDEGRRRGLGAGRFLLLGSASGELLRQSGESLAGRVAYLELPPLQVLELPAAQHDTLWLRGGFPNSLLAHSVAKSLTWRDNFIKTYLERELPGYGVRVPAQTLRRLWTMLAHLQGSLLDVTMLSRNLMLDVKTVQRYLDLLTDLMLLRRLQPWHSNMGKRLVKSSKLYVRDSGLVHALLGIARLDDLLAHPVVGRSWEGFVVETLLNAAPLNTSYGFYRSSNGAEVDLLLDITGQGLWAIEIKRSAAKPRRGFYSACEDLQPTQRWLVYASATDRADEPPFPLGDDVQAIGLRALTEKLRQLRRTAIHPPAAKARRASSRKPQPARMPRR